MTVKKDQTINVPLMLEKFTDVRVFRLMINRDPSKLEYIHTESFNRQLSGFDETNIVYTNQIPGVINCLWLNAANHILPNGTHLFVMVFKVKAPAEDAFHIGFKEVKAMDVSGSIHSVKFTDSKISVSDVSTAFKQADNKDALIKIYPNPASQYITLSSESLFDAKELIDSKGVAHPMTCKSKTNYTLDLQSYPSVVYFIKTIRDHRTRVDKFILNK